MRRTGCRPSIVPAVLRGHRTCDWLSRNAPYGSQKVLGPLSSPRVPDTPAWSVRRRARGLIQNGSTPLTARGQRKPRNGIPGGRWDCFVAWLLAMTSRRQLLSQFPRRRATPPKELDESPGQGKTTGQSRRSNERSRVRIGQCSTTVRAYAKQSPKFYEKRSPALAAIRGCATSTGANRMPLASTRFPTSLAS